MSDAMQQNADGTWSPSIPVPLDPGFSSEIAGHGPYTVDAWRGEDWVMHVTSRTKLGAYWRLWRAKRRSRP